MPSYKDEYRNCKATIKEYKRDIRKEKQSQSRWALLRRLSDYEYAYGLQERNIHIQVATVENSDGEFAVCTCGLLVPSALSLFAAIGHLYKDELTTEIWIENEKGDKYLPYCQYCHAFGYNKTLGKRALSFCDCKY